MKLLVQPILLYKFKTAIDLKGRVGDLLQKTCLICWLKASSHPDSNQQVKWSKCGRCRTITCLTNQMIRSERYGRLSYLPVIVCIWIPSAHPVHTDSYVISVVSYSVQTKREWRALLLQWYALCMLIFSHRWMRHEVIWQCCIQSTNTVSHHVAD